MKINPESIEKIDKAILGKTEIKKNTTINRQNLPDNAEDKIELSAEALEIKQFEEKAQLLPDTRPEKIAAIKTSLENGSYQIDTEKLAEKLLDEMMT
jgi:negative regulator of flagellin synthesis FlgM